MGEEVYAVVRKRLLAGLQKPGTFIREADLAEAMGVSRTPVREALGRLVSEGLLERIPHRGFRIPQHSVEDLVHLYPILQELEVLAGELAFPRLRVADLSELEAINGAFKVALEEDDVLKAVELNDAFHKGLSDRSGNPPLQEMLEDLRGQIRRIEVWEFTRGVQEPNKRGAKVWVRQHKAIIEAVRAGEFGKARRIIRRNRSLVYPMVPEGEGVREPARAKVAPAGSPP